MITTRCKVTDIETTVGKSTQQIELENLSPEAGMQVLREVGVKEGTDKELQQAAAEYDGHALALTLLGRYLAIRYDGEIRKRDKIKKLAYEKDKPGMHARHVMDSYETWLDGKPELDLLYIMGLFDRPAPLGAIEALKRKPVIKGLTDALQRLTDEEWDFTLHHLRDLRLLSAGDKEALDCHPLIREHFSQKLKAKSEQAWCEAHGRLYEYYKDLPKKELPDTLEEMEPLFAAVAHGCQAGFFNKTWEEVYRPKVNRRDEAYCENKLRAFGAHLSALSSFFEEPWKKPASEFSESRKAAALNYAGFGLRALGRLREAAQPMQASLDDYIRQEHWEYAAMCAGNLSELYLTSGDVEQAVAYARQSVEFADRSGDEFLKEAMRSAQADALHQAGELAAAEKCFREAEAMQGKRQPEYRYLYSLQGFQFCDLLLSQGMVREVLERYEKFVEWRLPSDSLLSRALEELSAGRAYLLQAIQIQLEPNSELDSNSKKVDSTLQKAADYLNQAVTGLREAGCQDIVLLGLFARAFFYRVQNQFPQAYVDLEEAEEIAERGGMKLWLVDYHLEASRLRIAEFGFRNADKPQELNRDEILAQIKTDMEQADQLVKETGYHRRDPEVELGYARLFFAQGDQVKARGHLSKAKALLDKMGIREWDFWVRELAGKLGG